MENHDYFEILRGNYSGRFETVLTIKKLASRKSHGLLALLDLALSFV